MNAQPTLKHKTFTFAVDLRWSEGRIGAMAAEGKPTVEVASPPEFKGLPGKWSPEDLFLSAANACQMTTFIGLLIREGLTLTSYSSRASGKLEYVDGGYRFTEVVLTPQIVIQAGSDLEKIRQFVEKAHSQCVIARSVNCPVDVHPDIKAE